MRKRPSQCLWGWSPGTAAALKTQTSPTSTSNLLHRSSQKSAEREFVKRASSSRGVAVQGRYAEWGAIGFAVGDSSSSKERVNGYADPGQDMKIRHAGLVVSE